MARYRVLFIDDEPAILKSLGEYFEKLGHDVFRADTGRGGISTFEKVRPDVTVLDLKLPDISGMEVLENLRQKQAAVLMLNRDLDTEREVVLEWQGIAPARVLTCETLTGVDLKAVNTFADPRRVAPQRLEPPAPGSRMTFKLPPRSYTIAHLSVRA